MPSALSTYRNDLHVIPELDFALPKTLDYIKGKLALLPGEMSEPAPSSLCIYFDAGATETLAFRADMDALPIQEKTSRPAKSAHAGQMHACGHDGHMAMALGLCDYVGAHLSELPHNVLVIFQPAEETTGGAELICNSGILAAYNVKAVFGLHMWPGYPAGEIISRPGPLMARCSELHITITGKSVHIAKAWLGADALLAGAELIARLQERAPEDPLQLLRFGQMHAGTVGNVVAGSAKIDGALRAFSDQDYDGLVELLTATGSEVATQTGCTIDAQISTGYPAVDNDAALFAQVLELGIPITIIDTPPMTGEDFSFYQREVPGVFFFVGTGRDDALHSETFDFDDSALDAGLALLMRLLYLPDSVL